MVKAAQGSSSSSNPYISPGAVGLVSHVARRGAGRALKPSSALKGARLKAQQNAEQGRNLSELGGQQASSQQAAADVTPACAGAGASSTISTSAPCSLPQGVCESSCSGSPGLHSQLHQLEDRQHVLSSSGVSPHPLHKDQHGSDTPPAGQVVQSPAATAVTTAVTTGSSSMAEQPPPLGLTGSGQVADLSSSSRVVNAALTCVVPQQQDADSGDAWLTEGLKTTRAGAAHCQ